MTEIHNRWLRAMLLETKDFTIQGHRGSFKTTVLSLFIALFTIIFPQQNLIYIRKTGGDVSDVAKQVANILETGCVKRIVKILYGVDLKLTAQSGSCVSTNLSKGVKGRPQVLGIGLLSSITGKHADVVVTDDIVNVQDRSSAAEREHTKAIYQELQNVKNRGGRIVNTGTPWHKEDAFSIMPEPKRFDCYSTGLMTQEQIEYLKAHMSRSLFAANYELKHVSDDDVLFTEPKELHASPSNLMGGIAHVDSAFDGKDYTALTIAAYNDGKYYIFGKVWRKNVTSLYGEIAEYYKMHSTKMMHTEKNADKGFVANELRAKGLKVNSYDESTNKNVKITVWLSAIWNDVCIVDGTDNEYLSQILDYTPDAEHDDAPDSAACIARVLYKPPREHPDWDVKNLFML